MSSTFSVCYLLSVCLSHSQIHIADCVHGLPVCAPLCLSVNLCILWCSLSFLCQSVSYGLCQSSVSLYPMVFSVFPLSVCILWSLSVLCQSVSYGVLSLSSVSLCIQCCALSFLCHFPYPMVFSVSLCILWWSLSVLRQFVSYGLCLSSVSLYPVVVSVCPLSVCILWWSLSVCILWSLSVLCQSVCYGCLLYTSPSPRDQLSSRMPSSA